MNGKHHQIVCPASARLLDLDRVTEQLRGWLDPEYSVYCSRRHLLFAVVGGHASPRTWNSVIAPHGELAVASTLWSSDVSFQDLVIVCQSLRSSSGVQEWGSNLGQPSSQNGTRVCFGYLLLLFWSDCVCESSGGLLGWLISGVLLTSRVTLSYEFRTGSDVTMYTSLCHKYQVGVLPKL